MAEEKINGNIYENNKKVGFVLSDGSVHEKSSGKIGCILSNGDVYGRSGEGKLGYISRGGAVYREGKGTVNKESQVARNLRKESSDIFDKVVNYGECFVATAVYGDGNAPPVEILREYRNKVLMNNPIGKAFVDFYYSGAGKLVANLIKEKIPGAIPLIRKGLDALVESYSSKKK